jgi:hypothetical protein
MKLVNNTHLQTRQLSKLLTEVARCEKLTAEDKKRVELVVEYRKRGSSWADNQMPVSYWGKGRWKFVGRVVKDVKSLDSAQVAKGIGLAFAAAQGYQYTHNSKDYGWGEGWRERWAWAVGYPVQEQVEREPVEVPPSEAEAKRMAHCLQQIMVWEKKAKLAATKLKVWNRRLRNLTRRGAKALEVPSGVSIMPVEAPKVEGEGDGKGAPV